MLHEDKIERTDDDMYRNLFCESGISPESSKVLTCLESAAVKLCAVSNLRELNGVLQTVFRTTLPDCVEVRVFFKSLTSDNLLCPCDYTHLPCVGIAQNAKLSKKIQFHSIVDSTDPVFSILNLQNSHIKKVLTIPVTDAENGLLIGVILAQCSAYTRAEQKPLDIIQKQAVACYNRINSASGDATQSHTDILNLCADLNDRDAVLIQLKIIEYVQRQTCASCGFLMLVEEDAGELNIQVIGDKVLPEEVRLPTSNDSFSIFYNNPKHLYLDDLPKVCRDKLESILEVSLTTFLSVPVYSRSCDTTIAFMCLINKLNSQKFTQTDIQAVETCFKYTVTVLASSLAVLNERRLKNETQSLLQVARNLFTHLDDLTTLLREIMQEARNLTHAERCSVFLIDEETEELVAKVFDGVEKKKEEQTEIRMPLTQGIAGHVATTGELLNIRDAYSHPLFYRAIDQNTGFRTRNILCFPIKDENGKVIGVAQLCNKKTSSHFTHFDEEIASAFSVYCCISIIHSLMYKKVIDAQQRNSLANELMMYHMKVSAEDVNDLAGQTVPQPLKINPNFESFEYAPRDLNDSQLLPAIMSMCDQLSFLSRWRIRRETLASFVLMARKGYRSPPYHNWMHAFSVAHFSYLLIRNLQLQNYLDDIELFALFISCICHDIDHRGTNNSFQLTSKSVLAQLYSSEGSVMERHHLAQSMCILNTEGCNIFENLSNRDYQRALDLLKDIILATDIAHHLRIMKSVEAMAKDGYDKGNAKHHRLLLCILMTSSDLSDQTKSWTNTSEVAKLIYTEFFSQGDLEKELGHKPVEMMDRERAQIPELQISFLNHIAQPAFKVLSLLFPSTKESIFGVVSGNKEKWQRIKDKMNESTIKLSLNEMLALGNY